MTGLFFSLITNKIVLSVLIATLACQAWKFIDKSIELKKIKFTELLSTGGMPSSHTTFVVSLALGVGFIEGFVSTPFLISAGFALIVMRDAFGVRHTIDEIIMSMNKIIKNEKIGIKTIRKIAGHSPVQVGVGLILGTTVSVLVHFFV